MIWFLKGLIALLFTLSYGRFLQNKYFPLRCEMDHNQSLIPGMKWWRWRNNKNQKISKKYFSERPKKFIYRWNKSTTETFLNIPTGFRFSRSLSFTLSVEYKKDFKSTSLSKIISQIYIIVCFVSDCSLCFPFDETRSFAILPSTLLASCVANWNRVWIQMMLKNFIRNFLL